MAGSHRWRSPIAAALAIGGLFGILVGSCGPSAATPIAGSNPPSAAPSAPSASASGTACTTAASLPWWNQRVFYEVFIRSFQDSDGDGIGDLKGLISRLDYLNDGDPATTDDLGVTGIWLMPVAESPSYHGYDVVDYKSIEKDYGTAEDFRALMAAAHERGIAVIVDLVLNHSSVEHPWFVDSQTPGSAHADWYTWSDTDPGVSRSDGAQVWHPLNGRYYYGYFWEGMPDLNLANPDVTTELDGIAGFWLQDLGVDGFRLDAIRHFFEAGAQLEDVPETKVWLSAFKDRIDQLKPDALLVGEAYSDTKSAAAYVPDSVDLTFDFGYAESILAGLKSSSAEKTKASLAESLNLYPPGQRAVFITNHDQPRVMTELVDVEAARSAAVLLLTSPGVPFIYYGEEIGLSGTKPDEQIRTPMPWTGEAPGVGFTTGTPWEAAYAGRDTFNVAAENADPGSLLASYRNLIHLRAEHPALAGAETVILETSDESVLAVARHAGDETVVVLTNLAGRPVEAPSIDLTTAGVCLPAGASAEALFGSSTTVAKPIGDPAAYVPVDGLTAYESVIIGLGKP